MTPKKTKTKKRANKCGTEGTWKAHMSEDIHCNATYNDRNCGIHI